MLTVRPLSLATCDLTAMMIELIELTAMLIGHFNCLVSATPCHPQHAVCRRAIDNLGGCEIARKRPPPSARPLLLVTITWTTLSCSPRGRRRCCALRLDGVVVLAVGDGVVVLAVEDGVGDGVVVFAVRTALSCSPSALSCSPCGRHCRVRRADGVVVFDVARGNFYGGERFFTFRGGLILGGPV
ncbi:hypothetical protein BD626DRAFT_478429, partial [Schizophyllum amplum]